MPDELADVTLERIGELIGEYARLCGRTNTEVAQALLASRTLAKYGYEQARNGSLTETQGQAAILVLEYWIGAKNGMH